MGSQVVHHYNLAFLQLRSEEVLQVGLKHFGSGAPLNRQAWPHPLGAHARHRDARARVVAQGKERRRGGIGLSPVEGERAAPPILLPPPTTTLYHKK